MTAQRATPDPLADEDGPNLYAYVHNNPLGYFDAEGLFSLSSVLGEHKWTTVIMAAVTVVEAASVVGMGVAGLAEGLLSGYADSTCTAISLALDAKDLYSSGAKASAIWTEMSAAAKANMIGKKIGEVVGIAASFTPPGRLGQPIVKTCIMAGHTATNLARAAGSSTQKAYNVANKTLKAKGSLNTVKNAETLTHI